MKEFVVKKDTEHNGQSKFGKNARKNSLKRELF